MVSSCFPARAEAKCVHTSMGFRLFFSSYLSFFSLELAQEMTLFFRDSTTAWISETDRDGTLFFNKS